MELRSIIQELKNDNPDLDGDELTQALTDLLPRVRANKQMEAAAVTGMRTIYHSILAAKRRENIRLIAESRNRTDPMKRKQAFERLPSILDTWIIGNKPLGLCTADDLKAEAERQRVVGVGFLNRAEAFADMAAKMGGRDGTVKDVLSVTQVTNSLLKYNVTGPTAPTDSPVYATA